MEEFLANYYIEKQTDEKPITHTSMKGGKWSIPEDKLPEFYKLTNDIIIQGDQNRLYVEKMHDYFPFVIDIDLKYKSVIEERHYTEDTIEELISFLWTQLSECIDIKDISGKGVAFLMEKEKPYPCTKGDYKSKDGIHLAFPEIIINKQAFKKIIQRIQNENKIKEIFTNTCEIGPDNEDKQILDSSFSSWQLYGCGKDNETPYLLTKVFKIAEDGYPEEIDEDTFRDFYTNPIEIMNLMSMCYRKTDNVEYKSEFMKTLKQKGIKKSSSEVVTEEINTQGIMSDMSQFAHMFIKEAINNSNKNPKTYASEEEIKYICDLVDCLSKERASDYKDWLDVGLCLHNINNVNDSLLIAWKKFSMKYDSYANGTSKRDCDNKWKRNKVFS